MPSSKPLSPGKRKSVLSSRVDFTTEELIAERSRRDPAYFAARIGFDADPWQIDLLRATDPRILANCARQSGKSSTTGILAVHTVLYVPNSLVILLSPALRQSQELFRKCLDAYRLADRPVPPEAETKLTLELQNGSRIISLPSSEATIRGFSGVRLIVVDEASRVPDELIAAVRPMLAVSGGRLIALSTPAGKRGWWHKAWIGDESWRRFEVKAEQCPRIPAAFLAEERKSLGDRLYNQEYGCSFEDNAFSVFNFEAIQRALDEDLPPLFPGLSGSGGLSDDEPLFAGVIV